MFSRRSEHHGRAIVPASANVSDDDSLDDDDDVADPDFLPQRHHDPETPGPSDAPPTTKGKRARPSLQMMEAQSSEDEDVEEDKDEEEEGGISTPPASKKAKRPTSKKVPARPTTWQKVDVSYPALPTFEHPAPLYVRSPQQHFFTFFSEQMVRHIAYQTNLYATQKDVNTTFSTTDDEIVNFVAVLLYMGVMEAPSLEDYWSMKLRVPQVAEVMSSKRFRLLRRTLHFNDNSRAGGSVDHFFKIRPLFSFINTSFQSVPQTSKQSIDEVMVGYKGKTAGNLRQYIRNKPDKWGFKLFSRPSEDGFVHDMVLYQGKTTLQSHGVTMTSAEEAMGVTSQIVAALVSTMNMSSTTAVFADNYFTSLELVRYLQGKGCRYTGTARDNRIGKPPLKSVKDMEKKSVPRGSFDYVTSDDGILAVRWKDNKVVTMLSTDLGVEPVTTCQRYSNETKKKDDVPCPEVIKSYNANMGGIDKSDMLVHLYRTPMKSKRWYMRLFAYVIDICLTNAWLLYRRDCQALNETGMSLKDFRIEVFYAARCRNPTVHRPLLRTSVTSAVPSSSADIPPAVRGHRSHTPAASVRFDTTLFHVPIYVTRQTCKFYSKKGHIMCSNFLCRVCKVHLCLNGERNCFLQYHERVA